MSIYFVHVCVICFFLVKICWFLNYIHENMKEGGSIKGTSLAVTFAYFRCTGIILFWRTLVHLASLLWFLICCFLCFLYRFWFELRCFDKSLSLSMSIRVSLIRCIFLKYFLFRLLSYRNYYLICMCCGRMLLFNHSRVRYGFFIFNFSILVCSFPQIVIRLLYISYFIVLPKLSLYFSLVTWYKEQSCDN